MKKVMRTIQKGKIGTVTRRQAEAFFKEYYAAKGVRLPMGSPDGRVTAGRSLNGKVSVARHQR